MVKRNDDEEEEGSSTTTERAPGRPARKSWEIMPDETVTRTVVPAEEREYRSSDDMRRKLRELRDEDTADLEAEEYNAELERRAEEAKKRAAQARIERMSMERLEELGGIHGIPTGGPAQQAESQGGGGGEGSMGTEATEYDKAMMQWVLEQPEEKREAAWAYYKELRQDRMMGPMDVMKNQILDAMKQPAGSTESPTKTFSDTLDVIEKLETRLEKRRPTPPPIQPYAAQVPVNPPKHWVEVFGLDEVLKSLLGDMVKQRLGMSQTLTSTQTGTGAPGGDTDLYWDSNTSQFLPRRVSWTQYQELATKREEKLAKNEEREDRREKWRSIETNIIKPVSKRLPDLVDRGINIIDNETGGATLAKKGSGATPQYAREEEGAIFCQNCGNRIPVPDPAPATLKCSKCGLVLEATAPGEGGENEKAPPAPVPAPAAVNPPPSPPQPQPVVRYPPQSAPLKKSQPNNAVEDSARTADQEPGQ